MGGRFLLVCLFLILAACGFQARATTVEPEAARSTPLPGVLTGPDTPGTLRPVACPFILPAGVEEGEEVECSYLPVYERRDGDLPAQERRLIRLAVAVFHPPGGATQADPVIFLSGGPGASILKMIRFQYDALVEPVFATGRSLIVYDQRGVGLSRPSLGCPAFTDLTLDLLDRRIEGRPVSDLEVRELSLKSLEACHEELAQVADLSAYDSANSADDVHELRMALGYEKVNLWGVSYGTRLALEVMRRYPGDLRSVVLDAVYPPDVDLYVEAPTNFQRSLTKLFESCAANQVCEDAHPGLETVFFETVARLNQEPVLREITNPFTGESHDALVNGNTLLALTFQMLYDSKFRYFIPQIIFDVSRGNFNYVDKVYGSLIGMVGISSRGMMLSVQCREELAFSSWEAYQAELIRHPALVGMYRGSVLGDLSYRVCGQWPVGQAGASANLPVRSEVPTLIMNGEFDPITPPAWGFQAAETLDQVYVFEYPGIGHGASMADDCPRDMMIAFLQDPRQIPEGGCIAGMQ